MTLPFLRRRTSALLAAAILGGTALAAREAPVDYRGTTPTKIELDFTGQGGRAMAQVAPPQRARYKTLLRKIEVAKDQQTYGDFYDYGFYTGTSYMEHTDLPAGYWVYVAPHWLIYKDDLNHQHAPEPRSWGEEQATGEPNTASAGDYSTAWASASADGQREWLELTYDAQVEAVGVMVYETYNPGAVDSVIAYAGNEQVQVWAGKDPTEPGKPMGVSVMGFNTPVSTNRVRINIDSPRVSGWNEIDAVGLIDKTGKVHWAVAATASSSYPGRAVPVGPQPAVEIERLGTRLQEASPGLPPGAPDPRTPGDAPGAEPDRKQ